MLLLSKRQRHTPKLRQPRENVALFISTSTQIDINTHYIVINIFAKIPQDIINTISHCLQAY